MRHFYLPLHRHWSFMPLSSSLSRRVLKQARLVQIEAFAREDGLWDIGRTFVSSPLPDVRQHAAPAQFPRFQSISAIHSYFGEASLAPDSANPETIGSQSQIPYQFGRCHALRSDGVAATKISFISGNSAVDGILFNQFQ
jgi:hypothetical protein